MRQREKEEKTLFQIGWSIVGILFLLYITYHMLPFPVLKSSFPCLFHSILGLYCPGCGGTRSISALLHGRFWDSFICHPLILYTVIFGGWFLISQTIERISKHKIKIGMHYRDSYLWVALVIVTLNFVIKNAMILIWHVDILANYTL